MKTNSNYDCFGMTSKAIIFILFLSAGLFAFPANAATVTTDHLDYSPCDVVTITGAGFLPGESVTLQIVHNPASPHDAAPEHQAWTVTANSNGGFIATWVVPCDGSDLYAALLLTAIGQTSNLTASANFTDAVTFDTIDFHQASNQNHPTTPISWINGILNPNNSDYTEGIGVPQRVVFTGIVATTGNVHTLTFGHQAVKGGTRAYDFLISWSQAVQTAANHLNNPVNELQNLIAQKCDAAMSAPGLPPCQNNVNHFAASIPDDAMLPEPTTITCQNPPNPVAPVITCFEGIYGNRTIDLYGDAAISSAFVTFTGYDNGNGDSYANYTLTWTSSSSTMVILMAGRSAQSCTSGNCCGYGPGCGSGSINGGPYHFKLYDFDGHTTGNQDNQLQATEPEQVIECTDVTFSTTNSSTCPGTVAVWTATISTATAMCSNPVHSWSISSNTSGAFFTGPTNAASVSVDYGATCGSFQLCDTITCDEGQIVCCTTITVADNTLPVFTSCAAGSDLGCNPSTIPDCNNITAPSATDGCSTPSVTCSAGSIISTSTCGRSKTITWTATDACGNSATCSRTWTWTEDITSPAFTNCTAGTDLGCNPTVPTCANVTAPSATDACSTPSVTCSAGSIISTSTCGRSRTITWTATDGCGNTSTCQRTLTWTEDTTPPVFTNCTAGSDLGCNPTVPTCANVTAPSATDACSTPSVTCSAGSVISTSTCGRSRTFTWTATDACGNTSTCSKTWTWTEDTTSPVFTNCTPGSDLGCNPTVPTCANVTAPSATDACSTPSVTCSVGSVISTSTCGRSRTITWTATDACANTSTCSATYTWTADTDDPVFDCPADETILCGDPIVFGTATATDVCTANPSVVITISDDVTINPDGSETHCRTWEATDDCGNVSTCTQCITSLCVGDLFCGFTQGFWGNAGGLDCQGNGKQEILTALLSTPLVVGCSTNTFTVGVGDYQCVLDRLPGGGPAAQIFGTNTCTSIVGIALHSGDPARFRNVLLAQTITTMLNVRYDANLGNLAIGGIYLTTVASDGCDTSAAPTGSPSVYVIPQSIIDYLGSNNTVNDLIALANDALCGVYTPSIGTPTLGDITKALDAFNQGFDECRFLVSFSNTLRADAMVESMTGGISMLAFPNPFNSMTSIDFTTGKAYSNVKVEVFSITGELVATLFNGPVSAGGSYRVNFDGAKNAAGVYTYRISTDTEAYYDKLILIK